MNIIVNLFFLFILLFLSGILGYPNYFDERFIKQKIILFMLVFCIQFTLLLINSIYNKQVVDLNNIAYDCVVTSVSAILGYIIYVDMVKMLKIDLSKKSSTIINLNIAASNVAFIGFVKTLQLVFTK